MGCGSIVQEVGPTTAIKKPSHVCCLFRRDFDNHFVFYPMDVPLWFSLAITVFLWLTLLFANFAEAVAEGRGRHKRIV